MKNIIYISAFLLLSVVITTGCKKTDSGTGINVNAVAPTVTTVAVTNIAAPTATGGGNITADGGAMVMEAGVCYDTVSGVTTANHKKTSYTISGNYSVTLDSLVMGQTYYYKAYAINDKGTSYGSEMSFVVPFSINGYYSSSEVAASNLVAYWAFEGGYVDSVSSTVGTPNHPTAISFVAGLKGQAVEIVSPGYINSNITNTIANLGSFTMACWIKHPANIDPNGAFYSYMPFALNATGYSWEQMKFFMQFQNADNASGSYGKVCLMDSWFDAGQTWPAMLDGNWHQLTISYNNTAGTIGVYVDGNLIKASQNAVFPAQTNFGTADSFTIGGVDDAVNAINGWANSINGDIDEFKVFNTDLSASDIQALYVLQSHGL